MNTVYQKYLRTFNIFLCPHIKLWKVKVTFSLASLVLSSPLVLRIKSTALGAC